MSPEEEDERISRMDNASVNILLASYEERVELLEERLDAVMRQEGLA